MNNKNYTAVAFIKGRKMRNGNIKYNILYAIANTALIFVVTYAVLFILEGIRMELIRFIVPGTEYSIEDGNIIMNILSVILSALYFPGNGIIYTIKFTVLFSLFMPICHLIEIYLTKKRNRYLIEGNKYISMLPYFLIGILSIAFLVHFSDIYTSTLELVGYQDVVRVLSGFNIVQWLKYFNYFITVIAIYQLSKFLTKRNWKNKVDSPSETYTCWFDIKPILLNILFFIAVIFIVIYPVGIAAEEAERRRYGEF